ncbi:hypothetical protein HPB50_002053 [Hyalomma asiaticum]|uniref:Uncharacterized protein n=1 Tax=Hyalomma asiaticum TaxID=266040 RepID=A0ACB7TDD4_HYAAI|nr:hypothetical protein HPB50_002053 [Hyalomma asiaticum]
MWTRQAKPEATAASRLALADEPIGNPKRRGSGRAAAAQFVGVGRESPFGKPMDCHKLQCYYEWYKSSRGVRRPGPTRKPESIPVRGPGSGSPADISSGRG